MKIANVRLLGEGEPVDIEVSDGIIAAIRWRGERYELRAPLYGLHHGRNIALALGDPGVGAATSGCVPLNVFGGPGTITRVSTTTRSWTTLSAKRSSPRGAGPSWYSPQRL